MIAGSTKRKPAEMLKRFFPAYWLLAVSDLIADIPFLSPEFVNAGSCFRKSRHRHGCFTYFFAVL